MSRSISRLHCTGWLAALLCLSTAAVADEEWSTRAADCFETLDGFNEGRAWAHYRITEDEVRVLVQSDGDDGVFVELACRSDGGLAEGPRRSLPTRVTGSGTVPPAMLARDDFDAASLERLAQRAREYSGAGDDDLIEFEASYLDQPHPRTVYRAAFSRDGEDLSVEFDERGVVDGPLALRRDELSDAPEPVAPGAALGLERLTEDPIKVVSYLAGRLGASTRINRFIIDPAMMTVEWISPDPGKILLGQWMIIDGRLTDTGDPTPPKPGQGLRQSSKHRGRQGIAGARAVAAGARQAHPSIGNAAARMRDRRYARGMEPARRRRQARGGRRAVAGAVRVLGEPSTLRVYASGIGIEARLVARCASRHPLSAGCKRPPVPVPGASRLLQHVALRRTGERPHDCTPRILPRVGAAGLRTGHARRCAGDRPR
jgi:hypothetical protein